MFRHHVEKRLGGGAALAASTVIGEPFRELGPNSEHSSGVTPNRIESNLNRDIRASTILILSFEIFPPACHKRPVFSAPSFWCVALIGMRRAYPFTPILPEKVMQTSKLRLCALIVASILPGLLLSACGSSDSPNQSACGGASVSAKMSCPPSTTPASSS